MFVRLSNGCRSASLTATGYTDFVTKQAFKVPAALCLDANKSLQADAALVQEESSFCTVKERQSPNAQIQPLPPERMKRKYT
jgi:hypothetical protein